MRVWFVTLLLGCSFHASASSDSGVIVDAPPMFDDAGHELRRIVFDSAANWNDVGAEMFDTSVDPWGSITQAGYAYGGVMTHGTTDMLWNPNDPDDKMVWTPTETATQVGVGCWNARDINDRDNLDQFGVTNTNNPFSLYIEGEMFLAAGVNTLALTADKVGFLEIAKPHTNVYTQVVVSHDGTKQAGTYDTQGTGAGWYPFHIGWTRTTSNYTLKLQIANRALVRSDVRTRGDTVRGLMRTVFDHEMIGDDDPIAQVDLSDGINTTFAALPAGATGDGNEWSAHYFGQIYIAMAGDYSFEVDSDDGNFVQVGPASGSSHWGYKDPSANAQTVLPATTFDVGWHDVVVDYNQINGPRFLKLKVASGPELAGMQVPQARLRSVEPRGNRLVTGADTGSHVIRDKNNGGQPGVSMVTLLSNPTEAPAKLDLLVHINSPHINELSFTLNNPGGTSTALSLPPGAMNGDTYVQFAITDTNVLGPTTSGAWTLTVQDNVNNGGDSSLVATYYTMHTQGGLEQVAPSALWRWTGDLSTSLASIDSVDWVERTTAAGGAMIQMRTCDMDKCADNPDWSPPLVHGTPPTLAVKRYLQIQVALPSDGTADSELQSMTIALRRNL